MRQEVPRDNILQKTAPSNQFLQSACTSNISIIPPPKISYWDQFFKSLAHVPIGITYSDHTKVIQVESGNIFLAIKPKVSVTIEG